MNNDGTGYTIIKNFPPTVFNGVSAYTNSDGASCLGGLIASGDTLYGTASMGGLYGFGTLFSLQTNGGAFTVLKHFTGTPDGKAPYGELLLLSNVLYGTTAAGGDFGKGTVFQINPDGSGFSIMKSFAGSDGLLPLSGLTWADGVFYGTTYGGGASSNGTVFSVTADGNNFATLKAFDGLEGATPRQHLVVCGNWIYGTTEGTGSQSLVYQLSTDGTQYNVLKSFSPVDPISGTNDDGSYTQSGLVACGGTLFGSTRLGGYYGNGVLFALRMDGSGYTVLKHFSAVTDNGTGYYPNSDGAEPGPLSLVGSTLYGTTEYGGKSGAGVLFSMNIAPRLQVQNSGSATGTNGFSFNIIGFSNQVVSVEATTDLQAGVWLSLGTNTIGEGPLPFVDTDATNHPQRFYRLVEE